MEIRLENVSYVYGEKTPFERHALKNVTLTVPSGAFVGIIGHTGSGKSTLIQLCNGLLRPSAGRVVVGETVIERTTKRVGFIRKKVGIVFQYPEHQLFEETVIKDISFGPKNLGWPDELIERRAKEAMRWVGLGEELKDRSPFELSGGQMRRVAIAAVLAMRPEVLILDEPTAGLDPKGRKEILSTIYRLHKEEGLTTILVTHHMEDAARYCDQLFVLNEGELYLAGKPSEVFKESSKLRQIGLDIPEITSFIMKLNERLQPPIPLSIFDMDDLKTELAKRVRK